jgi:hypothetical protein
MNPYKYSHKYSHQIEDKSKHHEDHKDHRKDRSYNIKGNSKYMMKLVFNPDEETVKEDANLATGFNVQTQAKSDSTRKIHYINCGYAAAAAVGVISIVLPLLL